MFALLFRFLPDVRLRWRDVTTGAFVTAVLFTIGQQLIGLYLGQSSMASSYGAAGSVMILLLWVYYSCQILLFGAEFTRVYAQRRGAKPARSHSRRRTTRLRVCGQRPSSRWTAEDARIGGSGASRRGRQPGEAPLLRAHTCN